MSNSAEVVVGNTLNVSDTTGNGFSARNIANFETVNLNVTGMQGTGQAVLELTDMGGTYLSGTAINAGGNARIQGGQIPVTLTLLKNSNGLNISNGNLGSSRITVRQGISLDHEFSQLAISSDRIGIEAVLTGTRLAPATGIFNSGRLATLGFLNQGHDLVMETGMARALDAIDKHGIGLYSTISGSDIQHDLNKGTHTDASGTHWIIGVAGKLNNARENDLIGNLYIEAGRGNIDSHNGYARGHGDTHYYGIGFNVNGKRGEYDEKSTYYGAGIRISYQRDLPRELLPDSERGVPVDTAGRLPYRNSGRPVPVRRHGQPPDASGSETRICQGKNLQALHRREMGT